MKLLIDISEYNVEYIRNAYRVPQDINMVIAEAIINGKQIPTPHGRLIDADELINGCEKLMRMLDPESKEYLRVFAIKSYLMWAAEYAVIEAEGVNI